MPPANRFVIFLAALAVLVLLALWLLSEPGGGVKYLPSFGLENSSSSSCINCHGQMTGMGPAHEKLACTSCHLGDNTRPLKDSAHMAMVKVPGNLTDAGRTCGLCHAEAVNNINKSLMTTNSGLVAVDKFIFGELPTPDSMVDIRNIHHSAADQHLRALCAKCHLGAEKAAFGSINELSRGGGCNACHLNYSSSAHKQLGQYLTGGKLPVEHPAVDLQITDGHCFGCHSRSGRIATNYQGYHETLLVKGAVNSEQKYKVLMDERVFRYVQEDVHHERGLACIDCHGYVDVMGDGEAYRHEEEAVKIACEDCHAQQYGNTAKLSELDFAQQRIFQRRKFAHSTDKILRTTNDSIAIINAYLDPEGNARMIGKLTGESYSLQPPAESCTRESGHRNISCSACHTGWAPQCIGCHVSYETEVQGYDLLEKKPMQGSWVEYAGSFLAGPPTLGVRFTGNDKSITPAIPGMIMSVDRGSFDGHPATDTAFYRLFAPAVPHTVMAKGRSCTACHNNPLALGYGRGELIFIAAESRWQFIPEYENLPADGLPADAWIGFLQEPGAATSTRSNFRPFTIAEQQRILTVGTCLTCHAGESSVMQKSLSENFAEYLQQLSSRCQVPRFAK